MKKIPTLFKRDLSLKCTPVTDEINPECQWVFDGEGWATRKIDGVNIRFDGNRPYIRIKPSLEDYVEADYEALDDNWPVGVPKDKYVAKAIENFDPHYPTGIYEAYGEGIRGNPESAEGHHMVRISPVDHALTIHGITRSYRGLMGYLSTHDIEGIVFHHRDGRMAKIKTKDFYHLTRP